MMQQSVADEVYQAIAGAKPLACVRVPVSVIKP